LQFFHEYSSFVNYFLERATNILQNLQYHSKKKYVEFCFYEFFFKLFLGSNKYPPKPEDGEERTRMATSVTGVGADWSCDASSFSHIFISTSSSGDACYLGITSNDCKISSGK